MGLFPTIGKYASLVKFAHTIFALPFALVGFFDAFVCVQIMGVRKTVTPVAGIVVPGFQAALRRRFPLIIGLDLNALL